VIALNDEILKKHKINTPDYREKVCDFITQYENIVSGLLKL